jgi:hypothetical protein
MMRVGYFLVAMRLLVKLEELIVIKLNPAVDALERQAWRFDDDVEFGFPVQSLHSKTKALGPRWRTGAHGLLAGLPQSVCKKVSSR